MSGTHTARGTGAGSAGESRIPETTAAVSGQWVVLPCERRTGLPASVELYVTATGALYLHCPVEANEVRLCRDQLIALRDILAHALSLGAHE